MKQNSLANVSQDYNPNVNEKKKGNGPIIIISIISFVIIASLVVVICILLNKMNKSSTSGESNNNKGNTSFSVASKDTTTENKKTETTKESKTEATTEKATQTKTEATTEKATQTKTEATTEKTTAETTTQKIKDTSSNTSWSDDLTHIENGICILDVDIMGMSYDSVEIMLKGLGYSFSLDEPTEWWGISRDGGGWDGTGVPMIANWVDMTSVDTYGFYFEKDRLVGFEYIDKRSGEITKEQMNAAEKVFGSDYEWYYFSEDESRIYGAYWNIKTAPDKVTSSKKIAFWLSYNYDSEHDTYEVDHFYTSEDFSGRDVKGIHP